ncbi:hypothetical protein P2318_32425 [Myxococcaceae bacterium GXIMD 01537]
MKKLCVWGTVVAGAMLTGCVTISASQYKEVSAGAIGCPPEELKIINAKHEFSIGDSVPAWTAECRGRRYICSHGGSVNCKEEIPPLPAPAAAPVQAPAPAPASTTAQPTP